MTAKYFGEYLVEKNVITNENLVEVLVEQIAATPPLCQIAFEKKILTAPQIFDAFRYQQENQVEFVEACRALNLWTSEVREKTMRHLDEVRKPLGQLLVKKGLIDLKRLTKMLDEFLSQMGEASSAQAPAPAAPAKPAPPAVKTYEAEFQPGILMELDETFDEKKKKIVRVAIMLARDNAGADKAVVKKLFQDAYKIVHTLNGLLSLLALEKLSEILLALENFINIVQERLPSASKEALEADCDLMVRAIDVAWALRVSVLASATEQAYLDDGDNQREFPELIARLNGGNS